MGGETAPGRVVDKGLYRLCEGSETWEELSIGLPEAPAIRALTVHPNQPEIIYAGTHEGPYRSNDHGDHWEKLNVPDRGLPVWSILFHPGDPNIIFVGYENCGVYRSDDGGEHWERLPVSVHFPDITHRFECPLLDGIKKKNLHQALPRKRESGSRFFLFLIHTSARVVYH